jgi:hypothetical protein
MTPFLSEDALMERAFRAHFKACRKHGEIVNQPSSFSRVEVIGDKTYVVLVNGVGNFLAVYRVRNDDVLRRLKRWPAELKEIFS